VTNPWDAGRDKNSGGFNMGVQPDISDDHLDSFRASFRPPGDRLSEEDYRTPDNGRGSNAGMEDVTPQRMGRQEPSRFTYPSVSREPKSL
jgi:hypothetical protein